MSARPKSLAVNKQMEKELTNALKSKNAPLTLSVATEKAGRSRTLGRKTRKSASFKPSTANLFVGDGEIEREQSTKNAFLSPEEQSQLLLQQQMQLAREKEREEKLKAHAQIVELIRKPNTPPNVILDSIDVQMTRDENFINMQTPSGGHTFLHIACQMGRLPLAQNLLQRNADPTVKDEMGSNCLHYLVERRFQQWEALAKEIMTTCYKTRGLKPEDVNVDGETVLLSSFNYFETNQGQFVKFLVADMNLNINTANNKRYTPM